MSQTSCNPYEKLLKAWLDGELDPVRSATLERHVAGCASCHAKIEAYRRLSERLRSLAGAPAPPPDVDAILAIARRARREEGETIRFLKRVAMAAAVVLISAVGALLLQPGSEEAGLVSSEAGRDDAMAIVLAEPSFGEEF